MHLDNTDLHTETFTNSQGWTVVRVTHTPSSISVERFRSAGLQSAVQAQKECIEEITSALAADDRVSGVDDTEEDNLAKKPPGRVSRAEFDTLAQRVDALERRLMSQG